MSEGPSISIGSITGGQNNVGKTDIAGDQNQTNHYGGDSLTFEKFIQTLKEQIPPEQLEKAQAEVLDPLCDIAAEPEPTNGQDHLTMKARIASILEKLEPYTPYIRKTLAAFAQGALSTIPPPASWVVAGCVEVVKDARND